MAIVDLVMPKMGESIMEATILKWHKQPGDAVKMDETVLEIATDKVDSEVPSTAEGILQEVLFNVNDVVPVGTVIARLKTNTAESESYKEQPVAPQKETISYNEPVTETVIAEPAKATATGNMAQSTNNGTANKFYSPLVLNIAASEGVSLTELEKIPGTGNEGRVTKKDILQYVSQRKSGGRSNESVVISQESKQPVQKVSISKESSTQTTHNTQLTTYSGNVEIIEMDRMRKLIADHMVMSKHTSPHVTSFVEADVTNMVLWRNKVKNDFEKREKEKITFTPLFIEAIVRAIKDYPMINCSLDGTKILLKKNINIGMATALPSGNLIVPVIKNADRMNLVGLTKSVNDLSGRARKNKLSPDEIAGGTFTLTNVGTFGNVMGTPIINQPQVAIMAAGAIRKKPAVIETEFGDTIGIRHMMFLSLSYDHRIVDGSLGGSFLRKVADYLEQFDVNRNLL